MTLHIEIKGSSDKPPLALLHGWGLHGGFWSELVADLAKHYQVFNVDLPGHGHSQEKSWTLTQLSQQLAQQLPPSCVILGWSLGGIVAQHYALNYGMNCKALILVASTPRFLRAPDWEKAAKHEAFDAMLAGIEQDFEQTVTDFMRLALLSGNRPEAKWSELKARVFSRGKPSAASLRNGLNILAASDFRFHVERIYCPVLCISGGNDRLTPPEASEFMAEKMPKGEWVNLEGASHAPFLCHPKEFVAVITRWLEGV